VAVHPAALGTLPDESAAADVARANGHGSHAAEIDHWKELTQANPGNPTGGEG
jgi:hypothetical protein